MTISQFTDFENADVETIEPIEYTGKEICPDVFMSYTFDDKTFGDKLNSSSQNTKVFERDKDFIITYENNINPGIATATLTGIAPNCEGSKIVEFEITGVSTTEEINAASQTSDNISLLLFVVAVIASISACFVVYTYRNKKN